MSKTKEIISIEHTLKEVLKNLSDQDIQEIDDQLSKIKSVLKSLWIDF